ncbi:TPA: hypothetical protein MW242_003303 [Acinetobacter baumannii]|nr:hypothetical protein [Acinetobacter baumannii]
MKHSFNLTILITLILAGCSADKSDKELVEEFYNTQTGSLLADVDETTQNYSKAIITKYYPEPYFNPNKPIPDYYAKKLDSLGVSYPASLVYVNEDYKFFKGQAEYNDTHYKDSPELEQLPHAH